MSDQPRTQHRDQGFNLPELLITITVASMVLAVVTSAVIVTLRNASNVEGRINLAADEQSIEYDMPTDLASAAYVDTSPSLSPCGESCPSNVTLDGSNAVFMTWTADRPAGGSTEAVTTNVSYYFRPAGGAVNQFRLDRIECESVDAGGWSCETRTVLPALPGPPGATVFVPGDTVPNWVIEVSEPLAPGAVGLDQFADNSSRKDANRVIVTIYGNGGPNGAGGGSRDVSITAGGTTRGILTPEDVDNAPGFLELSGRCAGKVVLMVDNSELVRLSKGLDKEKPEQIQYLRDGVRAFVEALAGTPTQLQVIIYDNVARVLDPSGSGVWTRYVDMTDRAEVSALYAMVDGAITAQGAANWEDGWFRAFFRANSTLQDQIPAKTVFFTAGFPNSERLRDHAAEGTLIAGLPPLPGPGWQTYDAAGNPDPSGAYYSNGFDYSQVGFDRADWFADRVRSSTRLISIGVEKDKVEWTTASRRYDYEYQRGWRRYQRASQIYEYWHRYYQQYVDGEWSKVPELDYYYNNTTDDESDGWRVRPDGDKGWEEKNESDYLEHNITDDESDFWRVSWDPSSWEWVTEAEYLANNTTDDESDGYRDAGFEWVTSDGDAMDWSTVEDGVTGDGYRYNKVYRDDGPYLEQADTDDLETRKLLSRLITGTDNPVKGKWDGGVYSNGAVAEVYDVHDNDWDRVPPAMRAAALSDCGGTVTVSTRVNGVFRAEDEFSFQTSALLDHHGDPLTVEPTVVTTNEAFPARSLTFDPPDDKDQWVTIVPGDLSSLAGYTPAATPWTCWSGLAELTGTDMEIVTIEGEPWAGVKVRINAYQAVSCELNVIHP